MHWSIVDDSMKRWNQKGKASGTAQDCFIPYNGTQKECEVGELNRQLEELMMRYTGMALYCT